MTQALRWLQDEIADRMLQKLDIVKLVVRDILLIPDFPGPHARLLRKRFPGVRIYSALEPGIQKKRGLSSALSRCWRLLCKQEVAIDLESYLKAGRINLPDHSVDLVFSDLLLQDLPDPKLFLRECWRVLREGGLLTFSYLGPDTGKELSAMALAGMKYQQLVSPWDMHDMGDALVAERFSDPVMDMELLTLDYEADAVLWADATALGLLETSSGIAGEIPGLPKKLTLEVIYGHAWAIGKHLAKAQNQVAYIDLNQIQRKTRKDTA